MKNYQRSSECNEYSLMKEVLTHGPRVMACVHRRLEICVFILFTCAQKNAQPLSGWAKILLEREQIARYSHAVIAQVAMTQSFSTILQHHED